MGLDRSKRIGALVLKALQRPAVLIALSHDERGALSDLVGELIEVNQRLDRIERSMSETQRARLEALEKEKVS